MTAVVTSIYTLQRWLDLLETWHPDVHAKAFLHQNECIRIEVDSWLQIQNLNICIKKWVNINVQPGV